MAGAWTVARWLRYWLKLAEPHLRPSTLLGYRDHIDWYFIPSLGRITLAGLTGRRLQACFDLLSRQRPGELYCRPPKSRASVRTIALDEDGTRRLVDQAVKQAVELLRHQFTEQRRSDSRTRTGPGWRNGRAMFTYTDGR